MSRFRDPRTLARYATVAAIVLVVGGLFLQREVLTSDSTAATDEGEVVLGITSPGSIEVGAPAPDFTLATPDGQVVALSDFHGKTVVLNFWATWCPPCRAEMSDLQAAFNERTPDGDFVVLAVDFAESAGVVQDFVDEFELTFPIAIDSEQTVAEHYGIPGLPASFFIDTQGIVRAMQLGPVFGHLLPDGIAAADAHAQ
jgi:peroxiredoxin